MAEKYSFFDSVDGDRTYYSADWALHLSKYFTNGIFNNGLQVVVSDGMNICVNEGDANINGYRYTLDADKTIAVTNASGTLNRIDNVVVRLDLENRQISTEIVTGDFAETAVAPDLTRDSSIYELRIAKISTPAGTTKITEDLITDTRYDEDDCGNVICAVENPDFSDILNQYEAIWKSLIEGKTEDFETWFDEMKEQLTEDAAGNIQTEIDTLKIVNKLSITIAAGTTISNGYEVTLPYYYEVGNHSLELRLNSEVLILATDDSDGHYLEVGNEGELSNTIQFYRTDDDGDWELDEDVILTEIVRGVSEE